MVSASSSNRTLRRSVAATLCVVQTHVLGTRYFVAQRSGTIELFAVRSAVIERKSGVLFQLRAFGMSFFISFARDAHSRDLLRCVARCKIESRWLALHVFDVVAVCVCVFVFASVFV